jgi:hypothetical protein
LRNSTNGSGKVAKHAVRQQFSGDEGDGNDTRPRKVTSDPLRELLAGGAVAQPHIGDGEVRNTAVVGEDLFEPGHRLGRVHERARAREETPQPFEDGRFVVAQQHEGAVQIGNVAVAIVKVRRGGRSRRGDCRVERKTRAAPFGRCEAQAVTRQNPDLFARCG